MPETHRAAFDIASADAPLAELIAHVVDPFIDLHRQGPGLEALFTGSVISDELTASIDGLIQHVEKSLAALFRARRPAPSAQKLTGLPPPPFSWSKPSSIAPLPAAQTAEGSDPGAEDRLVPVPGTHTGRMTNDK